jgi:SNF2 family DNA or RNA helicase
VATLTERFNLLPAPNLFCHLMGDGGTFTWRPPSAPPLVGPAELYEPEGARLYGFQLDGVRFLMANRAALLGDEMGLGKSIQAIAALRLLLYQGKARRTLILTPKTVFWDWYGKLLRWAPDLNVLPVEGPKRRREWYWSCDSHVFVAGYESFREDCELVPDDRFDLVILDEIQRIKNPQTSLAQTVSGLGARWRWGLSGTPMENGVEEVAAVFQFLKPGLLPYQKRMPPEQVRDVIAPFVLRRRKQDVLTFLPPKTVRTVWLDLASAQRASYDEAERQGLAALSRSEDGFATPVLLALINRLKQLCNLDPVTGCSSKCDFLLQELAAVRRRGEKALIFSQYPEKTLRPLLPRLAPLKPAIFEGSMRDSSRQEVVLSFERQEEPGVLAMSLKAGGIGLTLTRANHVFHFDHWWNPAASQQAEDRVHRIGQQKPVFVTRLLTRDTIEERIAELLERKAELFRQVMEPLTDHADQEQAVAATLTRDEMLRLLGIRSH